MISRNGQRAGEAVPDIEPRPVVAPAEAAKCIDGNLGLLRRDTNDVEAAIAQQKLQVRPAGLALAALDDEGKLDPAYRRKQSNRRPPPRARAKRAASGSPNSITTSAEVSTTIQRHMPVSS
jgi:hypothetical protein